MRLPVNVLFRETESHSFISASDIDAFPITCNIASHEQKLRLSKVVHLNFDHTWGKIPVWVEKTHRNSLIIYLVASDLISKGEDVYHPDAGQDGLKYTLFS